MLGSTKTDRNNGTLKNVTVDLPLKYLVNVWRLPQIPLINCKVELKLKWTKYWIFPANGNDNNNANSNNIFFTIKDTKLSAPVVTLSTKDNKKLSKILCIGFERSVYWNEYETKIENKNTTNLYTYLLESNF